MSADEHLSGDQFGYRMQHRPPGPEDDVGAPFWGLSTAWNAARGSVSMVSVVRWSCALSMAQVHRV